MRRLCAPVGAVLLLLTIAACAGRDGAAPAAPATAGAAFPARAEQVAEAWRSAPDADRWRTGFVPLQDLTVLTGADPGFTDATKQAFMAGWFRSEASLPKSTSTGAVTFADGQKLTVPVISAATAYAALDQGDPPPCDASATAPVEPTPTSPEGSTGTVLPQPCEALTVTAARLTTVPFRTSRGEAAVPAYAFTVRGLKTEVARVAVDPSAIGGAPEMPTPSGPAPAGLKSAQGVSRTDGTKLEYRLGLGACDVDVKPMFVEYDDVVVVGGTARTKAGTCTDQLLFKPVNVTLARPLGDRIVLDAATGAPQSLITNP